MDDPYRAPDPSWSSDTQASDDASFPGYNSGATPNYPPVEPDPSTFPSPPAYMPSQMPQQQWQSGPIGGPAPSGPLPPQQPQGQQGYYQTGAPLPPPPPAMAIQAAGWPWAIWPVAATAMQSGPMVVLPPSSRYNKDHRVTTHRWSVAPQQQQAFVHAGASVELICAIFGWSMASDDSSAAAAPHRWLPFCSSAAMSLWAAIFAGLRVHRLDHVPSRRTICTA